MKTLNILGIMSGSSMDGVDLALCELSYDGDRYNYKILKAETTAYDDKWRLRLSKLRTQNAMAMPRQMYSMHTTWQILSMISRKGVNTK